MRYFVTFYILLLSFANAQDGNLPNIEDDQSYSSFLVINSFNNKEFSALEVQNINKTILIISSKQKDYHLSISSDVDFIGVKTQVHSVSVEIKKGVNSTYDIKAMLIDLRKNKTLFTIERLNYERTYVQREVEIALTLLFSQESLKEIAIRERRTNERENGSQMKKDASGLEAFKKRIRSLKNALKIKFLEIKIELSKKKNEDESEDKGKEGKNVISAKSENMTQNKSELIDEASNKKNMIDILEAFNYLGLGYWDHTIQSVYITDTTTYVPVLNLTYKKGFFFDKQNTYYHLYTVRYGHPNTEYDIKVNPLLNLDAGIGAKLGILNLQSEIHLSQGNFSFGNVAVPGEGVTAFELTNNWLDFHLGTRDTFFGVPFKWNFYVGKLMSTSSNISDLDGTTIDGSRFGSELLFFNIYKMISIVAGYYYVDFSIKRFTVLNIGAYNFDRLTASGSSIQVAGVLTF